MIAGRAEGFADQNVEARILGGPSQLARWQTAGTVRGAKWAAHVRSVPTGGPYVLEVRAGAALLRVDDIFVGDLWILAGQSNMEGYGFLDTAELPDERVRVFDMADRWAVAREPLHETVSAADPVHWPRTSGAEPSRFTGERLERYRQARRRGAGLGLPFAKEMVRRTGVPVGLVPCAHGGTTMDQWDPALADRGGASLYGAMLRRFRAIGERAAGVLWYQGESDAQPVRVDTYQRKLDNFITALRRDFAQPDLPFFLVQIGRNVATQVPHTLEWAAAQEIQRRLPSRVPHTAVTASVDLELEDDVHVDTSGLKRLGARLAILASGGTGPQPVSVEPTSAGVLIRFRGVNGRLQSQGRPAGFTVHGPDGNPLPIISKTIIEGSTVHLRLISKLPDGAAVRYGYGRDPYCNVTDSADMPVPAFGPLPVLSSPSVPQ